MNITEKQAENTRVAYAIMYGIPHERINLDTVRDRNGEDGTSDKKFLSPACHTVGCVAGFLSAHPFFKEQGLKWDKKEKTVMFRTDGFVSYDLDYMSQELFGNYNLFEPGESGIDGKIEALSRIREHLVISDVITMQRDRQLRRMEDEVYKAGVASDERTTDEI